MARPMTTNDIINFFSGKKEYRSLSNFWENEIIIDDKVENIVFMVKNILGFLSL